MQQQVNKHVNINNKPWKFCVYSIFKVVEP